MPFGPSATNGRAMLDPRNSRFPPPDANPICLLPSASSNATYEMAGARIASQVSDRVFFRSKFVMGGLDARAPRPPRWMEGRAIGRAIETGSVWAKAGIQKTMNNADSTV